MTIFDRLRSGIECPDIEATHDVARRLVEALPPNTVLGLSGELGSGKTTLVQGIARSLGILEPVTSPTYTIYAVYPHTTTLLHMDAYRLNPSESIDALGIEDLLKEPWLMVVEWPEKVEDWLADWDPLLLHLEVGAYQRHWIRMK